MGAAAAVVGVVGGLYSASRSKQASSRAKRVGKRNAAAEAASTKEETRRVGKELDYTQSMARARAAASGTGGSTVDLYLQALEEAGAQELDWIAKVGASRYKAAKSEGDVAAEKHTTAMWGSVIGSAGSAASYWK